MKIAVIKGGPSPEAEISRETARAVANALKRLEYNVKVLELNKDTVKELLEFNPDKVFLALHGVPGEDGTVQGFLETLGIEYTGCNTQTSAICMDKDITKRVLKSFGIPVPAGESFFKSEDVNWTEFPCVVKPARTGSTVGISLVKDDTELEKAVQLAFNYDRKIIIEEYIEGREITVPVLNGKALPPIEVIPESGFYDYEAKYRKKTTRYIIPASLGKKTEERIKKISEKVFKILECRGAIRIDYRLSNHNVPFLLEINTIPGMTERSLLPKSAQAAGISFDELIREILLE